MFDRLDQLCFLGFLEHRDRIECRMDAEMYGNSPDEENQRGGQSAQNVVSQQHDRSFKMGEMRMSSNL